MIVWVFQLDVSIFVKGKHDLILYTYQCNDAILDFVSFSVLLSNIC